MEEIVPAGFVRSVAAFTCDLVFVFVFTVILMTAWAMQIAGAVPDTETHLLAIFAKLDAVPDFGLLAGPLSYLALSSSRVFGRRTPGMRLFGLQVVRVKA